MFSVIILLNSYSIITENLIHLIALKINVLIIMTTCLISYIYVKYYSKQIFEIYDEINVYYIKMCKNNVNTNIIIFIVL